MVVFLFGEKLSQNVISTITPYTFQLAYEQWMQDKIWKKKYDYIHVLRDAYEILRQNLSHSFVYAFLTYWLEIPNTNNVLSHCYT